MGINMFKINALIAVSVLGLSACGGGGSSTTIVKPTVLSGVFKDSNVSGLSFASGDEKGLTNGKGTFTYEEGKNVTFSIGGVGLGSALGKSVMTPIDLVTQGSLASPEVINKVRFLMMLDKDNTPSNGIEISSKVQAKAKDWGDVDFKDGVFPSEAVHSIIADASVEDGVSHAPLPDAETALKHLKTTLLCANAGAFVGSYTGSENGNIALMVDPVTGKVQGSSYNSDNQVSVEVKSTSALDYDKDLTFVSMEDSAKTFSGLLKSTEELDGTWIEDSDAEKNGAFFGKRKGGKSDAVYRYTVAFTGGDKGLFTFDVDSVNNVRGINYSVSSQEESNLTGTILDNKLTVTSVDGDELTGFIVEDTLAISGVWINGQKQTNGTFEGGGCRLN